MIWKGLLRKTVLVPSLIAAAALLASATAPAARADTMRTLNVELVCQTGEAYGIEVDTGSGFYQPSGSSTVSGIVKFFTVSIPASATTLTVESLWCDGLYIPSPQWAGPYYEGIAYSITPGTSTISAYASTYDYFYSNSFSYLFFSTSLTNITYS